MSRWLVCLFAFLMFASGSFLIGFAQAAIRHRGVGLGLPFIVCGSLAYGAAFYIYEDQR